MIPEELHLRNFLSHRETDLDLRGIHIASLVGDNGAGKSALLDAITWVVWGRSRAPFGREDDLIFHGETSLEVEFVFLMPFQGGVEQRYRILRRREHRGRRALSTQLDFQIEGETGWRILTAGSIRETQNRIIEHLGLDYDTFINSAYLRQGHADEFTVQTPAQRKHVLSAVLGLDRWSEYQERAKSLLASYQGELKAVNTRLEEIESELAHKPEYERALVIAETDVETAEFHLREVQDQVDAFTRAQEQAAGLRRQIEDLDNRLRQESERLTRLETDQDNLRERLEFYEDLLAKADVIERLYSDYQTLLNDERALGEKLSKIARLQQKKAQHENDLAKAREIIDRKLRDIQMSATAQERIIQEQRTQLERTLGELHSKVTLLEERLPDENTLQAFDAAQQRLAEFDVLSQKLDEFRLHLRENEVEQSRLNELNRQYRAQMSEAKVRMNALGETAALCPLCNQPLSESHREHLLEEISLEGKVMGDTFRSNTSRLQALSDEQVLLHERIHNLELDLRLRPAQEQLVARMQQQLEQGEQARERTLLLRKDALELEQKLDGEQYATEERVSLHLMIDDLKQVQSQVDSLQYAPEIRDALDSVYSELDVLGYDASYHEQVKSKVQALRQVEEKHRELENARTGSHREQALLTRLSEDINIQQQRILALENDQEHCRNTLDELQPLLARGAELTKLLAENRKSAVTKRQFLGVTKQNLAVLDTLEKRSADFHDKRSELAQYVGTYTELRDAFGVNGIPAMIIEHTLPELEREANRILQQLTGGRMHVRFDTQRETKTGNLRETLDIIISDEKGTRPYENFSGGEQFRANFAIRVALSRLLARRSGVRLRSLFIDEGFGSLDADGRQRLVEAIKTVQDSFQLIMVITHIDELREAFPTQILVTKSDAGSVVEVV